jgi:signal transduction histidine kinase
MAAMTPAVGRKLTIRAALALGFGATFGLWVFAGYYFTQRMADVQRESAAVNRRYTEAQELLSSIRTQVLLGSLSVRDALLDPDSGTVEVVRRQIEETYAGVDRALQQYVPILDSRAERDRVNGLRREIAGFSGTLRDVLGSDRTRWRSQARMLLARVTPMRTSVMQLSDNIQMLNRSAFVQQQQAVALIYAETQRRVWQTLGFAVLASLGIAMFATLYVARLERDLERRRIKERQATEDLQRLSTKLVSAQEEERRTIARELHDEIGQVLMAIKVELALAQRRMDAAGVPGRLLDDAQSITDGALHTVRDLSHLLHPALLDDFGLPAAVDSYLAGFGKRHGIAVELLHEAMDERLAPEIEAAAYRIVQEALTNVAKHAGASLAFVYLRRLGEVLQVSIEDNGVGFEPGLSGRGLGLIGIRERVAHLQGTVRIDSAPGRGTRLAVELPARARTRTADPRELDADEMTHPMTRPEVSFG